MSKDDTNKETLKTIKGDVVLTGNSEAIKEVLTSIEAYTNSLGWQLVKAKEVIKPKK
jgi:hypothetical protein